MNAGKGLAREALDGAITILVAVWIVRFAWHLAQPVLPVLVFGLVLYGFLRWRRS